MRARQSIETRRTPVALAALESRCACNAGAKRASTAEDDWDRPPDFTGLQNPSASPVNASNVRDSAGVGAHPHSARDGEHGEGAPCSRHQCGEGACPSEEMSA
jgi:hypothetical protein